jgi:hypothetical protein
MVFTLLPGPGLRNGGCADHPGIIAELCAENPKTDR